MTLMLILGAVLILLSVFLLSLATASDRHHQPGVERAIAALHSMGSSAPQELTAELEKPFSERVMAPLQDRALGLGRRLTGADSTERITRKLDLAGSPAGWSVDRVVSLKVIGAVAGLVGAGLITTLLGLSLGPRIGLTLLGMVVGYYAPDLFLYQRAHDRQERISKELADAIDLMTISVESGLAFDAAVQQVAHNTEGPLAEELSRVLREMQIGSSRADALRAMADRSNLDQLRSFISALVQADAFGIPIAQVLRVQSSEMRVKRRQRAEEKAQQVPVKMTVPLIFFILPCLFIAVLGPAAINIMDSFGG